MDKYIGKVFGGRYEILEIVGVGGMAVVYRARDNSLDRLVAIKILKDEFAKDPDIRRRFSIESQAVAKLSHHNIVSVYDVGSEDGTDYIVMELIEGITLKEYLQKKGCLPWQEALFFAQQIGRALVHAHSRGIIHQDIKPQNIIFLRDGTAKLTDFGIASFMATQETRVVQEAIGSVHYISPEQAKGTKIDYRADIYSLGVVMYEMLTGTLPFDGETAIQIVMQHINTTPKKPSMLQSGIPRGMDEIVMHAMCANRNGRYASAQELVTDLERLKTRPDTVFGYDAVTAEPLGETQVLGAEVRSAARAAQPAEVQARPHVTRIRTEERPEPQEPEGMIDRLSRHPGVAATIAVVVFAVIALIVAGILIRTGGTDLEKQEVPDFKYMNIDDVLNNEEYSFFTLAEAAERVESERPVGEIVDQSVDAHRKVVQGTKIVLTVSAGGANVDDRYSVPDFTERSIDYVTTMLDKNKVTYQIEEIFDNAVEKDKVVRTDPTAGSLLEAGQTLTVYVSKGKENAETVVPDLYGKTRSEAEKALSDAKLRAGNPVETEDTATAGTVVWQSVEAGAKASEGDVIDFGISTGSVPEPEPDTPEEPTEPEPEPEAPVQPTMGAANIPVALPSDADMVRVTVSIDGEVAYDQMQDSAGGATVMVSLTATAGAHEVSISLDGRTVNTYTYTFN